MVFHRQPLPRGGASRVRALFRLSPLLLFFGATVGLGLVNAVLQSVARAGPAALDPGFADMGLWYGYRELFMRPDLLASLGHSVYVALVSAVVSVGIGAVGAYLLWRAPLRVRSIAGIYRVPIILPHIVIAFVTILFWAPSGLVASLVSRLGIDFGEPGFPQLLFAPNGIGMILAYIYKEAPFVMLMALGVLDRVPPRLVTTAEMLGAGPVRVFRSVILPILAPILNQMFIILFLYALGGFDIPWLLGSSHPQMISMMVYRLYFQGSLSDRMIAMAALSVLAAVSAGFVIAYSRVARRLAAWERPI